MKFLIILLALFVVAYAAPTKDDDQKWNEFKTKHGKSYASASKEKERKDTFLKNAKSIEEHNAAYEKGEVTYKRHINKHSDLTEAEFKSRFTGLKLSENSSKNYKNATDHLRPSVRQTLPTNLDLRSDAGVGPVRDQYPCGSCWAFATISTMEYTFWLNTGDTIDLSEQFLVDCVYPNHPKGCDSGGWPEYALNWVSNNGGVPDEYDDPYVGYQKSCDLSTYKAMSLYNEEPFHKFTPTDAEIKSALYKYGLLAVVVDATGWESYETGVFVSPNYSGTLDINHGVSLIGYGKSSTGIPYWLLKNQWGTDWFGEAGYIRVDARRASNGNILGGIIMSENWYAIM